MPEALVIGTRGSELALWQAHHVRDRLSLLFPSLRIDVRTVRTLGDKLLDAPLSAIGDKGLFTKDIERALLNRDIDLAVHSLKDVPTAVPEGLSVAAVTEREDARDVFIAHPRNPGRTFRSLPHGSAVATGSLRRRCQILHARPDLRIVDIRGNLQTRFRKLEQSDWEGMFLAIAGVLRLGWSDRISDVLPFDIMLPAVGQGALALEIRDGDERTSAYAAALHHSPTALAVRAERALLRRLEGGCQVPIGALAVAHGNDLRMDAMIGSLDGVRIVRRPRTGPAAAPELLGITLAEELLRNGGEEILTGIRRTDS